MEETVARVEPAECRQPPVAFGTQLVADRFEIIGEGQNAVVSDQSVDLRPQGNEGDEINDAEKTKEQPAGNETGRTFAHDRGADS